MRTVPSVLAALTFSISATPVLAHEVSAQLLAGPSVVFDWSAQRCADDDIPDAPLRAVRLSDGSILGIDSHFNTRRFLGPDLGSLKRDCRIVYESSKSDNPADFADRTWLVAPWTDDGQTIYALSHNEYQADKHKGRCKFSDYNSCWYNTIGLFRSFDQGMSFEPADRTPIAAPTFTQDVDQGRPRGFFGPSNIIEKDGYFYSIIRNTGASGQPAGECLFRTSRVNDVSLWAYFDGQGYTPSALDPYRDHVGFRRSCLPLRGLLGDIGSLAVHKTTGLFIAVSEAQINTEAQVLMWSSLNLVEWANPVVLARFPLATSTPCKEPYGYGYPSLLDPSSPSRIFQSVSDLPFLYLTRTHFANCGMTLNRDLVRIPIRLSIAH